MKLNERDAAFGIVLSVDRQVLALHVTSRVADMSAYRHHWSR